MGIEWIWKKQYLKREYGNSLNIYQINLYRINTLNHAKLIPITLSYKFLYHANIIRLLPILMFTSFVPRRLTTKFAMANPSLAIKKISLYITTPV